MMSRCEKETCYGNQLRELWAMEKNSRTLTPTYLRWCDLCNTIYILTPRETITEKKEIPLLEYQMLPQMEAL